MTEAGKPAKDGKAGVSKPDDRTGAPYTDDLADQLKTKPGKPARVAEEHIIPKGGHRD